MFLDGIFFRWTGRKFLAANRRDAIFPRLFPFPELSPKSATKKGKYATDPHV